MTVVTDGGVVTLSDDKRQRCEVWDRVTGYYRPISEYNIGKKSEKKKLIRYTIK